MKQKLVEEFIAQKIDLTEPALYLIAFKKPINSERSAKLLSLFEKLLKGTPVKVALLDGVEINRKDVPATDPARETV